MPAHLAEWTPPPLGEHPNSRYRRRWMRCRVIKGREKTAADVTAGATQTSEDVYDEPPLIRSLRVSPIGALLPAEHSQRISGEVLGRSDGTPGQVFSLQRKPVLVPLGDDEGLEVCEPGQHAVGWKQVKTFSDSGKEDRHYKLDATEGEVEFGPAVRQRHGSFVQYGAIPPAGAELRFVAYRSGGGSEGNVKADSLTHLRRPVVGVRKVSNPRPAKGGLDGETLENARKRTAIQLRTDGRAVTARDFEQLCHAAAPERVARARALRGGQAGDVSVLIVPKIGDPHRWLPEAELTKLDRDLIETLTADLDECRPAGITVRLGTPKYRGVTVVAQVVAASQFTDTEALKDEIMATLNTYLNPVVGGTAGSGWEFGRALRQGELYPLLLGMDGVREVSELILYETNLSPGEKQERIQTDLVLRDNELIASGKHQVTVGKPTPR
jgi:predicted phage baseplate assembly protein